MAVLEKMFQIWGNAMMSKNPAAFDDVKPLVAEGAEFVDPAQEYPQAKAFFTSEPGPEGMAKWMRESFLEASFEPITATVLPQGSFMLAKTAIGNKVYFRNHVRGYKKGDKTFDNGKPYLEYYTVEFSDDNKILKMSSTYDKAICGKMVTALFGEASASA